MKIDNQTLKDTARKPSGMVNHLSDAQWTKLAPLLLRRSRFGPGEIVSRRGDLLNHSLLLMEGLIVRCVPSRQSRRGTVVALQFPGEFVDLHAFPLKRLDHDVVSLSETSVAIVEHEALGEVLRGDVELARKLWLMTLVDASIHRHWVMRNSAMRALARVANFLCEFDARMTAAHGAERDNFPMALRQSDIADATGLTAVHVSRTLRDLREDGCCTLSSGMLTLDNRERLHEVGMFDAAYLYMPGSGTVL